MVVGAISTSGQGYRGGRNACPKHPRHEADENFNRLAIGECRRLEAPGVESPGGLLISDTHKASAKWLGKSARSTSENGRRSNSGSNVKSSNSSSSSSTSRRRLRNEVRCWAPYTRSLHRISLGTDTKHMGIKHIKSNMWHTSKQTRKRKSTESTTWVQIHEFRQMKSNTWIQTHEISNKTNFLSLQASYRHDMQVIGYVYV